MKVKEIIYTLLLRLSDIAGYDIYIGRKNSAPYRAYMQDGLMSQHNNEFLSDKKFIKAYERAVKALNGIAPKIQWRVHVALWAAHNCRNIEGDYVECGVGHGFISSAIMEYVNWNELSKNFYLFDTFEGLDPRYLTSGELARIGDVDAYNEAKYCEDYQSVEKNFHEWDRVYLIKGAIPETLNTPPIDKVAYLHIDMNCVIPEIAAIEHFYPKLSIGSIILLDDYAYSGFSDQKKAMDKWADKIGVNILSLPTGQGMLVKTGLHP